MRRGLIALWMVSMLVRVAAAQPETSGATPPVDATMVGDAALADVCFVNRTCGWAVGERGVIWHTEDGGVSWRQQSSGVKCRLNSVCFIGESHGWAVGGASRPYSDATQGAVLRTVDGGQTWITMPHQLLPRLSRVEFFNANDGVVVGAGSSSFPSGIFVTHNGGRDWQPLPTDQRGRWQAGDFFDADTGAVAGGAGRFATVMRRQVAQSPMAASSPQVFRALRLVPPTSGWLVGDGGLVMTTGDLGRSWQTPSTDMPSDVFGHFDFRALAVHGPHVWIAGSPGTRVFHTADGGRTWQAFTTGHSVPLDALTFIDGFHGWAVGELGSILATQDGGQSWQLQRAGGQRAAVLAVVAEVTDVPLEVVAEQGAADGYLAAVEILHPRLVGPAIAVDTESVERTREAIILAGATAAETAWRFPLPPGDLALRSDELMAELNRAHDGRALEQMERHLVTLLRMWRPDVVITQRESAGSSNGEASRSIAGVIEPLILRCVQAAGEPSQAGDLVTNVGLEPWQVKKIYSIVPAGSHGDEITSSGRFAARLGGSLSDWSAPARRLLAAEQSPPDTVELKLLMDRTSGPDGPQGIFRGIPLPPGGEARRPTVNEAVGDVDDLRRLAARRRNLRELLERSQGNAAWVGQVERLLDGLDAGSGGELLFQLADGYRGSGRLDLAADTYYLLVRQYPVHPLAERALIWLVQFYASSETERWAAAGEVIDLRQRDAVDVGEQDTRAGNPGATDEVKQAIAVAPIGRNAAPVAGLSRDDRLRRAVQLGEYLEASRPEMYAEPAVRFPLVAAQRGLGFANPAKRYFLTLGQLPESDPWRRCAETEAWLAKPGELPPPKLLGRCRHAAERPNLDARLDELFWRAAETLDLNGAETSEAETDKTVRPSVRLAYDGQFLYLAIYCPKVTGGDYRVDDRPRPRDAELMEHDRVRLRLDVDRDLATWFELVVDHRGWTRDACWGESRWNPQWFVAATADETTWTVEAAVPLAELVAEPPSARHVWAVSARRTIPRVGYQSWSGEQAADESPEQFGLLIFE